MCVCPYVSGIENYCPKEFSSQRILEYHKIESFQSEKAAVRKATYFFQSMANNTEPDGLIMYNNCFFPVPTQTWLE